MNTLTIKMKRYYYMLNFKNMIKSSPFWICIMLAITLGYNADYMIHSDNRQYKTPIWEEYAKTIEYEGYKFTHIDFLQPQYMNIVNSEEMLALVKRDVASGKIIRSNPKLEPVLGDGLKFTVDDKVWFLISKDEKSHQFQEIE